MMYPMARQSSDWAFDIQKGVFFAFLIDVLLSGDERAEDASVRIDPQTLSC